PLAPPFPACAVLSPLRSRYPSPLFSPSPPGHRHPHSFPTRRSSDLKTAINNSKGFSWVNSQWALGNICSISSKQKRISFFVNIIDRKSTRLNSSHVSISYAVFCLRKTSPDLHCPSLPAASHGQASAH